MKVIKGGFGTRNPQPDVDVVRMLREAAEAAERGEVIAVFMVCMTHDDGVMSGWQSGAAPVFSMLGGIENAKHDFMAAEIEERP